MEAYTTKSFGGTATFTMDMLRESVREMDWLNYEVDPEWLRFMEFGPDDIGGVWETLGVIRKRQPPAYVSSCVADDKAYLMF